MRDATPTSFSHPVAQIRLLQTTDLHMQLIPFNYDTMQPAPDRSLVHLRNDIEALRNTGVATLLCDTGDFLQGNATADIAISLPHPHPHPHPMITAFNDLRYDAVLLGNHDFDYGITPLASALSDLNCPVLAANIACSTDTLRTQAYVIVPVCVPRDRGHDVVNVGLLGLCTPNIGAITAVGVDYHLTSVPPLAVAHETVAVMKAEGADIIVALCHFGIDPDDPFENIAQDIAALPDVDAVLAGHTHDVFPGPDIAASSTVDPVAGTLHGKPAVMAGAFGLHIGVVDLNLDRVDGKWQVASAVSRIVTPAPTPVPPPLAAPGLIALHEATLTRLNTPIAHTAVPLSTAFSLIEPDLTQQLLAQSRIARITQLLVGTSFADLPVLGSAAPYRVGRKHAPDSFISVPPGPVTLNDIIGIYPFRDPAVGIIQTGVEIRIWLEKAAGLFHQQLPGVLDQPLINAAFAPYFFTTLFGMTYALDISQPLGQRVKNMRYNGKPIHDSESFVVATTPYLKRGNRSASDANIIKVTQDSSQDILIAYLQSLGTIRQPLSHVWDFTTLPGTVASFVTSATSRAQETRRNVAPDGNARNGLQRFKLTFG